MRVAPVIELTSKQRAKLETIRKGRSSAVRARERAAIILLAADGLENQEIARRLGQDKMKVGRWRSRYARGGLEAILKDKSRPGRIRPLAKAIKSRIIKLTLKEKPPGATHWSRTTMANRVGVSPSSVGRVWAANGLKPHRIKGFKLSNDKHFEAKLEDMVGLYLNPPEHALVFSCDEKSQIQALDRTQPGLPLKKGRCQTLTHDYKRNGTTSLFAAMNTADGNIIGTCLNKHRHQEWIRFLNLIRKEAPSGRQIHLICDNYATHKHEKVKAWQQRNPRFHFHFTPTSASWLNMVERFFRDLTVNSLRRGVFRSVGELTKAIEDHIALHNKAPKPFVWTATASDILEKVKRGRAKLHNMQSA
jgi:transposase